MYIVQGYDRIDHAWHNVEAPFNDGAKAQVAMLQFKAWNPDMNYRTIKLIAIAQV